MTVAVGPHGSSTPGPALRKLGCDAVVLGECEEVVLALANGGRPGEVPGTAVLEAACCAGRRPAGDALHRPAGAALAGRLGAAPPPSPPPLRPPPEGPGAEVEASRGCPYTCSFCAKIDFRDKYRRRDLPPLLAEIDALVAQGVDLPVFHRRDLPAARGPAGGAGARPVQFGIQTRIDLWKPEMLALLGQAGCVSIEAGVESLTVDGRAALDKRCKMTTDELADRLMHGAPARAVRAGQPDRDRRRRGGDGRGLARPAAGRRRVGERPGAAVSVSQLAGLPPLLGEPDDEAWERAHRITSASSPGSATSRRKCRLRCRSWKRHAGPA